MSIFGKDLERALGGARKVTSDPEDQATVLDKLREHDAMDLAEMLGLA